MIPEKASPPEKSFVQPEKAAIRIARFTELDEKTQAVALAAIANINKNTSTTGGKSDWSNYTPQIMERSKEKLYVALVDDAVVGYAAFYNRGTTAYITRQLEGDKEVYCSWTAVDKDHQGKGIATQLKKKVFEEQGIDTFVGHIKQSNIASLAVLRKFGREAGYEITESDEGQQIFYKVHKLSINQHSHNLHL